VIQLYANKSFYQMYTPRLYWQPQKFTIL